MATSETSRRDQPAAANYAVRSDGTLFSRGNNGSGQLGNGTHGGFTTNPAPVPGLPGVTQAPAAA